MKDRYMSRVAFTSAIFTFITTLIVAGILVWFEKISEETLIYLLGFSALLCFGLISFHRITKIVTKYGNVELTEESQEKLAEDIKNIVLKSVEENGSAYENHELAFKDVEKKLKDIADKAKSKKTIEIRILGVAMHYSWEFINELLARMVQKYPDITFVLDLLTVDPGYIKKLRISKIGINWYSECEQRCNEIVEYAKELKGLNVKISHSTYQSIPPWHGILVNGEYLFLGRTIWQYDGELPQLKVGQNKYRYFDSESIAGVEKIELYSSWFKFYKYHLNNPIGLRKADKVSQTRTVNDFEDDISNL